MKETKASYKSTHKSLTQRKQLHSVTQLEYVVPATQLLPAAPAVSPAEGRHPLEWIQRIPGNTPANSPQPARDPHDLKEI